MDKDDVINKNDSDKEVSEAEKSEVEKSEAETKFILPIEYLDENVVHPLSEVVASDLELVSATASDSMYETLLKPKHQFAKDIIRNWKKSFTSDTEFLKQTQQVISSSEPSINVVDCDAISTVLKDIYETPAFHDRYSYIDIDKFHFVNSSSNFLGFWTVANLLSPIFSLILPLILIIAPFVLLKIQRVPIEFNTYITVLKDIAKKHALGKVFSSMNDFSMNNLVYILFTIAMYGMQMYQNVKSCMRFYKNIHLVNTNLLTLKQFVDHSIQEMEKFLQKNSGLSRYRGFCHDVSLHCDYLIKLKEELNDVKPFSFGVSKCFEVGYLLKCYYSLHSVAEYKLGLQYAVSFEGYRSNLESLAEQVSKKTIHFGKFNAGKFNAGKFTNGKTVFKNQQYPTHTDSVLNTIDLKKNLIITGPNASGKTTQLKTTAINIIFTQQFGLGFYESASLTPYTHIHSYLNIPDTSGRDSLFQAEARRCKEILDIIDSEEKSRHFCIFDELFSGTNADEATSASFGFLKYLQKRENVDFILTTHFVKLCKMVKKASNLQIQNFKMDATIDGNNIVFHYKLVKGISKIKAAKLILVQMGFPEEVVR
jgi:hypothetical protein